MPRLAGGVGAPGAPPLKPPTLAACQQSNCDQQRRHTLPDRSSRGSRRTLLLSFTGLAWAPGALVDALKGEASLWQQEADLYRRQAAAAFSEATGIQVGPGSSSQNSSAAAAFRDLPLDAGLAAALLAAPLQVLQGGGSSGSSSSSGSSGGGGSTFQLPQLDMERYERDYAVLLQRELPYFRHAGACGHCGSAGSSPEALSDRDWFDFSSYIQYKALARQLGASLAAVPAVPAEVAAQQAPAPALSEIRDGSSSSPGSGSIAGSSSSGAGGSREARSSLASSLRLAVGAIILDYIQADLAADLTASSAGSSADSGSSAAGRDSDNASSTSGSTSSSTSSRTIEEIAAAIARSSPDLDSIRAGVQALLAYFQLKGFVAYAATAFFGASKFEERNHYVWSLSPPEPAFLKYWLQAPATLRSAAALQQEEGFSQDYVAAAVQAYLWRCGVAAGGLRRYPSYTQPDLVAEQWTLKRVAPLPPGYDWQEYVEW